MDNVDRFRYVWGVNMKGLVEEVNRAVRQGRSRGLLAVNVEVFRRVVDLDRRGEETVVYEGWVEFGEAVV